MSETELKIFVSPSQTAHSNIMFFLICFVKLLLPTLNLSQTYLFYHNYNIYIHNLCAVYICVVYYISIPSREPSRARYDQAPLKTGRAGETPLSKGITG